MFDETRLYSKLRDIRRVVSGRLQIWKWRRNGCPVPPPHIVKQKTVIQYAKLFCVSILVETGTFSGEMISSVKGVFKEIYSIELDPLLFENARRRFAGKPHIHLLNGDSAAVLSEVLDELKEPALFWLDGHYSGEGTAKGEIETPIKAELAQILEHAVPQHVILIDDARMFTGENDYPTLDELKAQVHAFSEDLGFEVEADIIRIHKMPRKAARRAIAF